MIKKINLLVFGFLTIFAFSCTGDKSPTTSKELDKNDPSSIDISTAKLEKVIPADTTSMVIESEMPVSELPIEESNVDIKETLPKPIPKKEVKKEPTPTVKVNTTKRKPATKKMAQIEFEKPLYDFGEIVEGDIVNFDINFTNTGDAPLQILEADVTCGCTTPAVPFLDIDPGQSNKIAITYNSVNKSGAQNPTITIKSNTDPAYHVIHLKGFVKDKPKEEKTDLRINDSLEKVGDHKKPDTPTIPSKKTKNQVKDQ